MRQPALRTATLASCFLVVWPCLTSIAGAQVLYDNPAAWKEAISEQRIGAEPSASSMHEVPIGEPVYSEFDYKVHVAARLIEGTAAFQMRTAGLRRYDLPAGSLLYAMSIEGGRSTNSSIKKYQVRDKPKFCSFDLYEYDSFRSSMFCLVDVEADGIFESYYKQVYRKPKKLRVPYELTTVPWRGDSEGRKVELVYQGAVEGVLRLLYREYVNDFARPAFIQDLVYELSADGATTVMFRDLRIEVETAGNEGITYRLVDSHHNGHGLLD